VVTWLLAPDPPCEQVLAVVGVGCWALASPILRHCPVPCPPSSWPSCTCRPPYEQWLIGMGVDAIQCCVLCVVVVPVSRGESVTWQGYGWALVCILQVSPSRGLLAPLPDILSLTETLTSWMGRRGSVSACGCGSCCCYQ
jgi:hypothetical protein